MVPAVVSTGLEERADQFESIITGIAMDDSDIVRDAIHGERMAALQAGDVPASSFRYEVASPEGYNEYEDAGIATGVFLVSQVLRYECTGQADALEAAMRSYRGIRYIYELGRRKVEGFFPKPYNKTFSEQISRDQYLYVMYGLAKLHRIASSELRSEIEQMLHAMGRYWVDINYSHDYMGLECDSHLTDFMASLILGIIRVAADFSNDPVLQKAYDDLFEKHQLGPRMPETLREQFRRGQTYDGGMYFRCHDHCINMKALAVDYLWDSDAANRDLWRKSLQSFWDNDMLVSLDREEGLMYYFVGYDPDKDDTYICEPGVRSDLENPLNIPRLTWGGRHKSAQSTELAFSALVVADRLGLQQAADIASLVVQKVDLEKCRTYTVPGPEHVPPGEEYEMKLLRINYLSYWLWSYWRGRQMRLW